MQLLVDLLRIRVLALLAIALLVGGVPIPLGIVPGKGMERAASFQRLSTEQVFKRTLTNLSIRVLLGKMSPLFFNQIQPKRTPMSPSRQPQTWKLGNVSLGGLAGVVIGATSQQGKPESEGQEGEPQQQASTSMSNVSIVEKLRVQAAFVRPKLCC